MANDLRTRLKALVEEWKRTDSHPLVSTVGVRGDRVRQLAALLAESEPEDDPVGHEFVGCDYSAGCDWCHYRVGDESCCQPRSAHEPK